MRSFCFTAKCDCIIKGYVVSENEKEARKRIYNMDVEEIMDEDIDVPVWDIKITNGEDID